MIKFSKMHGLGNDFLVLDGINQRLPLSTKNIQKWSDRHTGIGFDQCLVIEPSARQDIDFFYRIFNADGQEVGQCGNGARCLALFIHHHGLSKKQELRVATITTEMKLIMNEDHSVSVTMGIPKLAPAEIPLNNQQQDSVYTLNIKTRQMAVHAINVGNPHAVLVVPDLNLAPIDELGPLISTHPDFPEQTNVGFMQIVTAEHIKLRVYERGCGETQACGSAAVAAAAIARLYHRAAARIQVSLLGGNLTIDWPNTKQPIVMTGPAELIYEGFIAS